MKSYPLRPGHADVTARPPTSGLGAPELKKHYLPDILTRNIIHLPFDANIPRILRRFLVASTTQHTHIHTHIYTNSDQSQSLWRLLRYQRLSPALSQPSQNVIMFAAMTTATTTSAGRRPGIAGVAGSSQPSSLSSSSSCLLSGAASTRAGVAAMAWCPCTEPAGWLLPRNILAARTNNTLPRPHTMPHPSNPPTPAPHLIPLMDTTAIIRASR